MCAGARLLFQNPPVHNNQYPSYVWAFLYLKHPKYGRVFEREKKKKDIFFCRMIQCPISFGIKEVTLCSHYSFNVSFCLLLLHKLEGPVCRSAVIKQLNLRTKALLPRTSMTVTRKKNPNQLWGFGENLVLCLYILCAEMADLSAVRFSIF